jgi:hypothetical protein
VGRRLTGKPSAARVLLNRLMGRRYTDWHAHMPAAEIAANLPGHVWADYAKITCVRNPFERCVSQFHWRTKSKDIPEDQVLERFKSFLQTNWPNDEDIVCIDGKIVVDHFIRQENLEEDLRGVCDVLGVPGEQLKLPRAKDLTHLRKDRPVHEYYDQEGVDIVRARFKWLFDIADYPDRPVG